MRKNLFIRNGILFITVLGLSVAGVFSAFAESTSFSDLKTTHWAYENIMDMSEKGIVKGYPNGQFKPSNKVTYAEFIKMCDIAVLDKDSGSSKSGHWATNYYNDAVENKMFTETEIPKTKLNSSIPRADMALIVSNALDNQLNSEDVTKIKNKISDIASAGDKQNAVIRAYGLGIITGYVDGTFKPSATLNRAEACSVIARIIDESKRIYPNLDEEVVNNKLSSLISNAAEYGLDYADTYTLDNASKYNFVLGGKNGYTWFDHTMRGDIWLVKDKKVIEYTDTIPANENGLRCSAYTVDITKVDYIVSGHVRGKDDIVVVANPFKK